MITVDLAPKGTTGTGLKSARNFETITVAGIEFEVEVAGGTPTVTFTVKGCPAGKDASVSGNYVAIAYLTEDSTVAAATTAITLTSVSKKVVFLDGLDKRFFSGLAVDVTANTNITYSARVNFVGV